MLSQVECPPEGSWQTLLDPTLDPDQRERLELHLESCSRCQDRLDHAEEFGASYRLLGQDVGDPTLAPCDPILVRVLQRLQGARGSQRISTVEPEDLHFLQPSDRPDLLGVLGGYEIREVIGQGGMGIVFKAFDPALERMVAIKVLAAGIAGSSGARKRFAREARAAASVQHDHIVAVHGIHEVEGLPYLVMQYIAGESVQDRLVRYGKMEILDVVRIGLQTARGLAAAHAQGLVHRDIKPANILLEAESGCASNGIRVKITDFGLARMADGVRLTQDGVVAGTPEYMAPEQARGESVDYRADLFSLGSVLYAACTGTPPYSGSTPLAVLRQVSDEVPCPLRSVNPEVPVWLEMFINRLMARSPGERFQSASEVASLLEGYLAHLTQPDKIPAPQWPSTSTTTRPSRRGIRRWLLLGGIVCGLSLLGMTEGQRLLLEQTKSLEPKDGLLCLLVNKNSGRCLSVAGQNENVGSMVVQGPTPDKAGPRERWTLLGMGNSYRLLNESNHLVVEIWDSRNDPGVGALQAEDHVTMPNQHWTFEESSGHYILRADHSQLVLAVSQSSQDEGAPAMQWTHVPGHPDQLWKILPGLAPPPAEATFNWTGYVLVGLGLCFALLLGIWLGRRHQRPVEKTDEGDSPADPQANPATTDLVVSFACTECGKNLKAKGRLIGKKVKCQQCGKAVLVPGKQEDESGIRTS